MNGIARLFCVVGFVFAASSCIQNTKFAADATITTQMGDVSSPDAGGQADNYSPDAGNYPDAITGVDSYKPPVNCTTDGDCDDGDPGTTDACNLTTGECEHKPTTGKCSSLTVVTGWGFQGMVGPVGLDGFPSGEWNGDAGQSFTWCGGNAAELNVQQLPNGPGSDWVVLNGKGVERCVSDADALINSKITLSAVFIGVLPSQLGCVPRCDTRSGYTNYVCPPPAP